MDSNFDASFPTSNAALIFPSMSGNFSKTLSSLKKSRLSIRRRLSSILEDWLFVRSLADRSELPLIANERCGSWYIPPEAKVGSVYFKSTDGHQGQWTFSTRRLNVQLLEIVEASNGCIIVDSTRRGKSIPDALSKTIPIWCAVMNRYLFPNKPESHVLIVPSRVVGKSEIAQMNARLDGFVQTLKELRLDLQTLRSKLKKPLHPQFITNGDPSLKVNQVPGFHPIICCSASRQEVGDDDQYVQGAGDDTENWAHGLTPEGFWHERERLLNEEDELDLQTIIEQTKGVAVSKSSPSITQINPFRTGPPISICTLDNAKAPYLVKIDGMVLCVEEQQCAVEQPPKCRIPVTLYLHCPPGKLGSKALREQLPSLLPFMKAIRAKLSVPRLLFACKTGKDHSVGVALATLCLFFAEEGEVTSEPIRQDIDKIFIRRTLAQISLHLPEANPSRATLNAVNSFLMKPPNNS